ncbi:dehydrogenase/reductase SDR family member 11-like [Homalodisca vitripennis]|uniref:dehydrogenase/reductase SDR family member 11-like n=1 Tax=Homalodisca vitripennis TaxID=197043 RepID=UPI001EEC3253|nr:dehydrogenase/reductase SDR family member 11-like [Homalodisca vitripennis]
MERWRGRVAVVTGASAGIGAAITRALVEQGMIVVGLARREALLQELATELGDSEGKLIPRKCDLSVESDIVEAFEWIEDTLKGADVIINNAGIMDNTPLLDAPTTIWRQMLDINILALVICSKLALNSMLSRGVDDGHVININSLLGHKVMGNLLPFYSSTKWAVTALCRAFQNELFVRQSHIRVTSMCPGLTRTEQADSFKEGKDDAALSPADVADAVIYALSTPSTVIIEEMKIAPNDGRIGHSLAPTRTNQI